jgi:hypothetical protein
MGGLHKLFSSEPMPGKIVPPDSSKTAFTCPSCETLCPHRRTRLFSKGKSMGQQDRYEERAATWFTNCVECGAKLLWHEGKIVFPATTTAPLPHADLPDDLKETFEEARAILGASPRGAAALLRYVIDCLTKTLSGLDKADINTRIAHLVREKGLAPQAQQALDSVRVIGANAVHPLEIDLSDDVELATILFTLVNGIVEDTITRPREIAKVYSALPERNLAAIAKRDDK